MPAQPTTDRAMNRLISPRPRANMIAIANSRSGKANSTSTVRMMIRSTRPP